MKSDEVFAREVRQKAAIQRARRKRLTALAVALPVLALGAVALSRAVPVWRGSDNAAVAPEAAGEERGPFTLEAAPGRLMDVSYQAFPTRINQVYEDLYGGVNADASKEDFIALQEEADRQIAALEEEQNNAQELAKSLGLARNQNLLDPAFARSVAGLNGKLAPLLLDGQENGCLSPLSLYLALSLLGEGARGDTQRELLDLLDTREVTWLADQCGKFIRQSYAENELRTLKIENSLWAADRLSFQPNYLDTASQDFYTSLFRADFTDPAVGDAISRWISDNTNGLLRPQLDFDANTVLALVNTLYFYEQWHDEFNADLNTVEDFTLPDGQTTQAIYMHRTESQTVYFGENFTAAALALKGGDAMTFILPDQGVSPDDLLADPELAAVLAGEKEAFLYRQVEWSVPKFSMDSSFGLEEALQALGVEGAFDPNRADFSGIGSAPDGPLVLSQARQDVHIAIDEKGVEAAAFTLLAVEAGAALPPEEIVEMKLDRPFLFAVTSSTSVEPASGQEYPSPVDTLLFYGVCARPTPAE